MAWRYDKLPPHAQLVLYLTHRLAWDVRIIGVQGGPHKLETLCSSCYSSLAMFDNC